VTEILETEEGRNGLQIVVAYNDCRLGLSVRIEGCAKCSGFIFGGRECSKAAFQDASKHTIYMDR
jgi:hypothetical protein